MRLPAPRRIRAAPLALLAAALSALGAPWAPARAEGYGEGEACECEEREHEGAEREGARADGEPENAREGGSARAGSQEAGSPRARWTGYTLEDAVERAWRRIFSRTGLPDEDGPLLQRFAEDMGPRYELDMRTQAFPRASERAWAAQRTGARLWVRSLDALELAIRMQLRTEVGAWEDGYVGLQYEQEQNWATDLRFFRFEVGHRGIAGADVDGALRIYPRFDKNDIDVEAIARAGAARFGDARIRVGALDPFINATSSALEYSEREIDEHTWHLDPPLAVAADFQTQSFRGLRAEVHGGAVLPQRRSHEYPDAPGDNHVRRRRALLGGGVLEWRIPGRTEAIGASVLAVDAEMSWEFPEDDTPDASVSERTVKAEVYAHAAPRPDVYLEAAAGRTLRPESWSGPGTPDADREDREWLWSARAMWMATRVFGLDLHYLGNDRRAAGPPDIPVQGRPHRLVTRAVLELGEGVWSSFGVGWSLDSGSGPYDRGGMTLIYTPPE